MSFVASESASVLHTERASELQDEYIPGILDRAGGLVSVPYFATLETARAADQRDEELAAEDGDEAIEIDEELALEEGSEDDSLQGSVRPEGDDGGDAGPADAGGGPSPRAGAGSDPPRVPPPRPRTGAVRPPPMPTQRTLRSVGATTPPGSIPRSRGTHTSSPEPFVPAQERELPKAPAPSGDDVADFMSDLLAQEPPAPAASDAIRTTSAEWFNEVFDATWLQLRPSSITHRTRCELAFLDAVLPSGRPLDLLDVCCGDGRHAIPLARRGHAVTGVDLSKHLLKVAYREAEGSGVEVRWLHGDMRHVDFQLAFDAVLNMDTSFGYFDDRTNYEVVQAMARSVRRGGLVIFDVVHRDHVVARSPRSIWWETEAGIRLMEDVHFRPHSSVLDVKRTVVVPGEVPWEQSYSIRLYAIHEWRAMLAMAGLEVVEVSGSVHYRGVTLGAEDPRTIIVARRP
jgi:SAM-dependent methyltransferase